MEMCAVRIADKIVVINSLRITKLEGPSASIELVALNTEPLLEGDVEITKRHIFTCAAASIHMAQVLESSPGYHDG